MHYKDTEITENPIIDADEKSEEDKKQQVNQSSEKKAER